MPKRDKRLDTSTWYYSFMYIDDRRNLVANTKITGTQRPDVGS